MGLYTIAMDGSPDAPGLVEADVAVVANILDPNAIQEAARTHAVDAIYPAAELTVEATADAIAALGLVGPAPAVATRVRNKLALREALESAGLPNPAFRGVGTQLEAEAAAKAIGLPVIVKPVDANSSKGVRRVDAMEDVSLAFALAKKQSRTDTVLVEEFLDGDEYNVDGLVYEGRYILGGMTGKDRSPDPYRFDRGIFMPPLLDGDAAALVERTVAEALAAIGYTHGTTHAEVILSPEGPRIVEIAGRPGGGRIPTDLIPLVYGMDFMADSLRIALGEAPRESWQIEKGVATYWLEAPSGVVTDITGVDEAKALPGVHELHVLVRPGDVLGHIIDCVTRDRIGYVFTTGESAEEAIATAKRVQDIVQIHTRTTIDAE